MADGGVSIAVQSGYLGKQGLIRSSEVSKETKKPAGEVMHQERSFVGMSNNRIRRGPVGESVWRHFKVE
jgi:hypothetical protein